MIINHSSVNILGNNIKWSVISEESIVLFVYHNHQTNKSHLSSDIFHGRFANLGTFPTISHYQSSDRTADCSLKAAQISITNTSTKIRKAHHLHGSRTRFRKYHQIFLKHRRYRICLFRECLGLHATDDPARYSYRICKRPRSHATSATRQSAAARGHDAWMPTLATYKQIGLPNHDVSRTLITRPLWPCYFLSFTHVNYLQSTENGQKFWPKPGIQNILSRYE